VAAIAAAEADIVDHCNAAHADAMAAIAAQPGHWRIVAADVDGCDLAQDDRVVRKDWAVPVADPAGLAAELIRLSGGAGERRPG
jgi:heme iron utilization protein